MPSALAGLSVLDASESIAGQFCGRLFADYGAEVTLIEPPDGSALRRMGPFDPAPGGGVGSMLFFHLNLGKRSVTLDLKAEGGRALIERARSADVVIAGLHVDAEALRAAHPGCIVCVVSDFGEDGPYRDWRGSEMIFQALSGIMFNNGDPGREPLYGCGHRAQYAAGVGAYIATLTALHARHVAGGRLGQTVRLDVAHNTAAMGPPNTLMYSYSGMMEERGHHYSPFGVLTCSDGWVGMWVYPHTFEPMCNVLECRELMTDPRFDTPKQRVANWDALVEEVQKRVLHRTSDDVLTRLHKGRLVAAKAYKPNQLYHGNAHLEFRHYWDKVETPSGPATILGPSFRMSATPRQVRGPAPQLGADNQTPAARPQAGSTVCPEPVDGRTAAQPGKGALSGLRVVEFTTAWAGPMAGRICAFFGAEVIHVESATRLDVWRQNNSVFIPRRYAGGIPGERPYNRVGYFNSQNLNKLSLTLDIKDARGRDAMRRLLDQADVVVCNFTAGTLARMGFGYEALSATNPGIIVVEMPGFGNTGPLSDCTANGATMELASGMSALIGYPDGAPTTTGQVYPDPMGGFNAAAAILTALAHRDRDGPNRGHGQYVEMPQVEASMQFIGEELLHAIATGVDPRPHGNRVRWAAPHDAYLAAGEDQWVAIAVETDAEWQTLCRLMGRSDLAGDARYASFEPRWRNQDELRPAITAWTRTLSKYDIAERLQAAGVRAAPVRDPKEVTEDPYLAHRNFFVELTHPEAGTHRYPSLPFRLSHTPGSQHRASPCLGADTRRILTGIVGLSESDVDELDRDGVTSAIPAKKNAG